MGGDEAGEEEDALRQIARAMAVAAAAATPAIDVGNRATLPITALRIVIDRASVWVYSNVASQLVPAALWPLIKVEIHLAIMLATNHPSIPSLPVIVPDEKDPRMARLYNRRLLKSKSLHPSLP